MTDGIPAASSHVRSAAPGFCAPVENVGLHDAVERSILVPAGYQHSAIGQLGVSGAEDVVSLKVPAHGRVGGRVPNYGPGEAMVRRLLRGTVAHESQISTLPFGNTA